MEVRLSEDALGRSSDVVFLYKWAARVGNTKDRLRQGLSLSSYGTNCAAFSGIPPEVIARAEVYTRLQSQGTELVGMIRGENDEEEMTDLRVAEGVAKRFVEWEINVSAGGRFREELVKVLSWYYLI
jgi:DNA mismatch repair ATPase MutS